MASVKTWARQVIQMTVSSGGRARFFGPAYPVGSTLERSIFGFSLWLDGYYGGDLGSPRKLSLLFGLVADPDGGAHPDFDPGSTPEADWLWAGMVTGTIEPLRQAGPSEYRLQFASPPEQLQSAGRDTNTTGTAQRIYLITDPLSSVDSGFTGWSGVAYFSVVFSTPG